MRLGEVAECIRGVTYNAAADLCSGSDENGVPLLRANNISGGKINYEDVLFVNRSKVKSSQFLIPGDILVCASSGSKKLVGKAALVRSKEDMTFGAFCCAVRPKAISPLMLGHYFQSSAYRSAIENVCTGSNINNLKPADFYDLTLPQYGALDQAEKASKLDAILKLIELCEHKLSLLDQLAKSRFVEMFGRLEDNPNGWPIRDFEEFAAIDTRMTNDFERYANVPHIGIDSIESGTGVLSGYRTVAEDGVKSGKYPFGPQHIIYSKIRPVLNKVALPDFEGVCSADAYPILPSCESCSRVFLAHVLRSDYFLDYVLPLSGRAQMPKVNKDALRGFSMPLPPLALQQEFASFVAQVDKSQFVSWRRSRDCLSARNRSASGKLFRIPNRLENL